MMTWPQLAMVKSPGPTRSFICAVPELPDERLTPDTFPNAVHTFGEKTPAAVRLMPASPNSLSPSVWVPVGPIVSTTVVPVLTLASANPPAVRFVAVPQHGGLSLPISHAPEVTHRRRVSVGVPAPPSKS
jgi:hypothetical protein